MAWIQIRINANADNAEMISDLLMDTGSASVTYVDAKDTPIYEPKLSNLKIKTGNVSGWITSTRLSSVSAYGFVQAGVIFQNRMQSMYCLILVCFWHGHTCNDSAMLKVARKPRFNRKNGRRLRVWLRYFRNCSDQIRC